MTGITGVRENPASAASQVNGLKNGTRAQNLVLLNTFFSSPDKLSKAVRESITQAYLQEYSRIKESEDNRPVLMKLKMGKDTVNLYLFPDGDQKNAFFNGEPVQFRTAGGLVEVTRKKEQGNLPLVCCNETQFEKAVAECIAEAVQAYAGSTASDQQDAAEQACAEAKQENFMDPQKNRDAIRAYLTFLDKVNACGGDLKSQSENHIRMRLTGGASHSPSSAGTPETTPPDTPPEQDV